MKCELYFCSGEVDTNILTRFQDVAPGIKAASKKNLSLLGAPVFEEAFLKFTTEKFKSLETMINRLIGLPSQVAYFFIKNCSAIPKLTYLLRTSPAWKFPEWCSDLDNQLKNGGLGIRKITDITFPAFLASTFGVHALVNLICPSLDEGTVHLEEEAKEIWNKLNPSNIPTLPTFTEIARLKASQLPESGAWLQAIPSSHIGTLMDNYSFRVCVALRIGSPVCRPHNCVCGAQVSVDGRHGLHCGKGSGRFLRHNELNDILKLETFGPWSKEAQDLLHTIGTNLNQISDDSRSKQFLTQRISSAIQRGNAACVFETLPFSTSMEEIFYLT
ncbi:hypothetical protein ILUMI_15672 [Ignelater luminosus]|uniref:Uncharacterized protein n=1 Tax=Ignelater luminosus TaxID=2038154 RepID=A0A8K0G6N0_IGNLU|nr:hypothetical protein ILUMI_15672 [Ignelater luminosus]